jgi:serine---pyruvate transaminase
MALTTETKTEPKTPSRTDVRTSTRVRLYTPGPVEIPTRILRALSAVPPHHRTEVFRATLRRVIDALRELHRTQGEVFLLGASGSGAMEAAVVNVLQPGDKALVIVGGKFGERWLNLVKAYGVAHEAIDVEWGHAVDLAEVERRLSQGGFKALFSTHSETSTGALHDIQAIAKLTRARNVLLVVDAITSLGIHPLAQDEWGVDVIVCGSQKGLMVPPGLATLSLAPWASGAIDGPGLPRFYFDLRKFRKAPPGETPWTPPVSLTLALEEAITMINEEGLDNVHARHRRVARAVRAGATALGYRMFAADPSHALTALYPPEGIADASLVIKRLREVHSMVVAGGQDHLKGKIFRVGHMGATDLGDVLAMIGALEECAGALGKPAGGGTDAALKAWSEA